MDDSVFFDTCCCISEALPTFEKHVSIVAVAPE